MINDICRIVIVSISRTLAKCFVFFVLSVSMPTINAMRSLEEGGAIVIVVENGLRRRDRSIRRYFGYAPGIKFVMDHELRSVYV